MRDLSSPVNATGMFLMSLVPMITLGALLAIPGDDYGRGKLLVGLVAVLWCGIPSAGFWMNRAWGGTEALDKSLANTPAPASRPSSAAAILGRGLDHLNHIVKDSILDFSIGPEPNEFAAPNSEDIRLRPLDLRAFEERMRPRVSDAIEVTAEILSKPATDRELAECAEQLAKVADSFRWNALEVAMELRTAESRPESDTKNTQSEMAPKSWAKKFRLMRASGF